MKKILITTILIFAAAAARLIPHPPNFTPLAAMALAGGVYLDKRFALVVPLVALLLSDAIIGFHNLMVFVYGSFFLTALIGLALRDHKKPAWIAAAALSSSLLFFLVTNFGVWLVDSGAFYPKSLAGLLECYTAAIPFFRNTIGGDLVYTALLFGVFETAERFIPSLKQTEFRAGR